MIKIKSILAGAAVAVLAVAVAGIAAVSVTVTAFTVPAHASTKPQSATQQTCSAFTAWERHRTAGNLHAMVADSFRVPPKYLGADVAQLYADIERGHVKYLGDDATYVNQDCGG